MVSLEMTPDGPAVDSLGEMLVHPAAELFPLMQGQEFEDLVADIREHGQHDPVVLTPDGQLLDGRNRWRACARAGVEPRTRVEDSEPWAFVISTNVHRRHLNESQRAMIAAKLAQRKLGQRDRRRPDGSVDPSGPVLPPTAERVADLFNVSVSSIKRAREVRAGAPALQEVVETGVVPVFTAARVARDLPSEQQEEFVSRVRDGAEPVKLANRMGVGGAAHSQPATTARADNRSPHRHRHLSIPALRNLNDSLSALDMVVRSTPDGLDPAIDSEEAARWLGDLSKGRSSLGRVLNLLKERKESTS